MDQIAVALAAVAVAVSVCAGLLALGSTLRLQRALEAHQATSARRGGDSHMHISAVLGSSPVVENHPWLVKGLAVVILTSESCRACRNLLQRLPQTSAVPLSHTLVLVRGNEPDSTYSAGDWTMVAVAQEDIRNLGITAFPTTLVLFDGLVVASVLGDNLGQLESALTSARGRGGSELASHKTVPHLDPSSAHAHG